MWGPKENFKLDSREGGRKREGGRRIHYIFPMMNYHIFTKIWVFRKKSCSLENIFFCCCFSLFLNAFFLINMYNINIDHKLCCLGLPQSSKSSCDGGPSYCQASNGYSDSSCASSNGGWASDVDSLDTKNHCGRGSYSSSASTYFTLDSTTFQGTCTSYSDSHCISDIKLQFD